jgi:D-alanyl-D-alanine carboxypeptidase
MFRYARVVAASMVGAALVVGTCAPATATRHDDVGKALQRLTTTDGIPGALVEFHDRTGTTALTSGVADTTTGAPVAPDSRFRIGSMTKPFVATVVLQLVGEGKVVLDAPVENYLPGVIRGNGNDGRHITVRQLLQHTSGVPDYLQYINPQDILANPKAHYEPQQLIAIALQHRRDFKPGHGWKYSNTNYVLAGMLIRSVTGHSYNDEIERRIIQPLGLHDTSVPTDATDIPGTHPHGYANPGSGLVDVTAFNPSIASASGSMISSGHDIDRFLNALLAGHLLHPAQLKAMKTTHSTGGDSDRRYGLGLQRESLPCGGTFWGHDGDVFGFETMSGATATGRQATVMATLDPGGADTQDADMQKTLTTALCPTT